jgi:hypothetical protein
MALVGTIGPVPQSWRHKQPELKLPGLQVLALTIQTGTGLEVVASSYSVDLLRSALGKWLEQPGNRERYVHHKIHKIPFVMDDV